jgi:hypothetical protein
MARQAKDEIAGPLRIVGPHSEAKGRNAHLHR